MLRMLARLVAVILVVPGFPVVGDDAVPLLLGDPAMGGCTEMPPETEPVDFTIHRTFAIGDGGRNAYRGPNSGPEGDGSLPDGGSPAENPVWSLSHGQQILSEADYEDLFGAPSGGVDWSTSRIVVFEEFTSYRLGDLDMESRLDGVYRLGDSIVIREMTTHHGPCQGIAQDPAWFSFGIRYLLIVVPRLPEPISYWECSIGDCPPDIP